MVSGWDADCPNFQYDNRVGNWALPFQSSNRSHKSSKHIPISQKPPTPLGTISNHGIDANRGWTFAQAENLGLTFTTGKQC